MLLQLFLLFAERLGDERTYLTFITNERLKKGLDSRNRDSTSQGMIISQLLHTHQCWDILLFTLFEPVSQREGRCVQPSLAAQGEDSPGRSTDTLLSY